MFNTDSHTLVVSEDGSCTAYSEEYGEHYHSTRDGALHESLVKHVTPAFNALPSLDEITILDICFGLGFNTLATLHYVKQNNIKAKINIYSPELDAQLIESLPRFRYPQEFRDLLSIVNNLVLHGSYEDDSFHLALFIGDARDYVLEFEERMFDIVYQDAFSPATNPVLWTQEYFRDIARIMKKTGVVTTYSIALPTRLALFENGFHIYVHSGENFRDSTIASLSTLNGFKEVDMQHKISCNPQVKSLRDL